MKDISRRRFLGQSAGTAAGITTGLAAMTQAVAASANDKIVMALIGCGGRGFSHVRGFVSRGDVDFKYVAEVNDKKVVDCMKWLDENQKRPAKRLVDMRAIFDDDEVDAVVVATTDHWHALATVWACQAGKDVYVEKPASHNIWEGRKMVEAARKYNRIVQVGTQNRSAAYNKKALEYIRSGKIGRVHLCKVFNIKPGGPHHPQPDTETPDWLDYDKWIGPAPMRPYNEGRVFGWHGWWDYSGGDMSDCGVHQLDLARMLLDDPDHPTAVHCTGGNLAFDDGSETPDVQIACFEFPNMIMTFDETQYPPYMSKTPGRLRMGDGIPYWPENSTRIELYGTKELMIVGRHGGGWQTFTDHGEIVHTEPGVFPEDEHKEDFIQALRTRSNPSADIEQGHKSACLVHLGNIAMRAGNYKLMFDGASERFVGDHADEANRFVKREYRKPYVIHEEV